MFFFGAYMVSLTLYFLMPPLVAALTSSAEMQGLADLALIMIWILGLIVVPSAMVVQGLRDTDDTNGSILGIASGVLFFVFGVLLTVFGWFMMVGLGSVVEGMLAGIFWVGLVLVWVLTVVVTPIMQIMDSSKNY
jgi:hypothetical protein